MKISVITAVYNNQNTIEDAIKSVLSQTHNNVEYIVIDGQSTDIENVRGNVCTRDIFRSDS